MATTQQLPFEINEDSSSRGNNDNNGSSLAVNEPFPSINCFQLHVWYETFKRHTIKSRVIPLDSVFIDYLNKDGVILPQETTSSDNPGKEDYEDDDSSVHTLSDDESSPPPSFPELTNQITEAIEGLGGSAFVKLNWSCASDASWMLGQGTNGLKCANAADVYLLLKSSDRIQYDLTHTNSAGIAPPTLILKQWRTINPSQEFRMFVYKNRLIGISQRDCYTYYPFLSQDSNMMATLTQSLIEFYDAHIHLRFPAAAAAAAAVVVAGGDGSTSRNVDSFALDVFVTTSNTIKIIDFNVWGDPTDALMFDWDYLNSNLEPTSTEGPEVRIVRSEADVMIDTRGAARGPIDVSLAPDFYRFMDICREQENAEASAHEE